MNLFGANMWHLNEIGNISLYTLDSKTIIATIVKGRNPYAAYSCYIYPTMSKTYCTENNTLSTVKMQAEQMLIENGYVRLDEKYKAVI